jgi:hypothetical protein
MKNSVLEYKLFIPKEQINNKKVNFFMGILPGDYCELNF